MEMLIAVLVLAALAGAAALWGADSRQDGAAGRSRWFIDADRGHRDG